MPIPPAVPLGGLAGYQLLQRTSASQQETFARSPDLTQVTDAFLAKAPTINSIDALLEDRRALEVALGAFGLEDQVDARAFLRKILEDGVDDQTDLANRLSDTRWRDFAAAFEFESAGRLRNPAVAEDIVTRYTTAALANVEAVADSQLRQEVLTSLLEQGVAAEDITEEDLAVPADIRLERIGILQSQIRADADFVRTIAPSVATIDIFLADESLVRVTLGAFGLAEEAGDTAKIREYLQGGVTNPTSPANLDRDPRWRELVAALDFAGTRGSLSVPGRADQIVDLYRERQFELAVGEQQPDLELALGFKRSIGAVVAGDSASRSGWFRIMGNPELRSVIEGALNLPASLGQLDIDLQRERLEDRAEALFGERDPTFLRDPNNVEEVIRRFLLTSQIENGTQGVTPGSTALTILQSGGLGAGAQANLFASRL
ncbi:MAG: DUF1217 domain-containing protein [Pseudomonadota bacterium]